MSLNKDVTSACRQSGKPFYPSECLAGSHFAADCYQYKQGFETNKISNHFIAWTKKGFSIASTILKIMLSYSNIAWSSKGVWKQVKPTILIYDAECSLCCGCMNWIKSHAIKKDTFEFISCQSEELKRRFPDIRQDACIEAFHLVTPDDRVLTGDMSLPGILCRLRYFRLLSFFLKMPIISSLSYAVYRWLANNRYVISKTILPLIQESVK